MMKVQLILSFCLWYCIGQAIADVAAARAGPKKVVCYWGTWAYYRPGGGQFALSNVDPRLCTHVIYTFAGLADCAIKKLDPNLDDDKGFLRDLPTLKRANSGLKVSIAIGGWNEGSEKYSTMASDAKCRGRFIQSVKAFLNQYKLDGFDVDWEYPGQRGGRPADKANYISLLCGLREAFQGKYLLSAAVGAPQSSIDISYDVRGMNRCLDFINLMAYDFHGSWDGKTGHNAPLKSSDALNDDASVSAWLKSGASADKLILGIPLYGHTYTLKNAQQNGLGAATSGPGPAGQYTREAGMVGYNEICEFYKGFQMRWDDGAQVPYSFSGSTWISYDDPRSVQAKAKYAAGRNLGGAMVWSIETDDFNNRCGGGKYPLLNAIRKGLSLKTFAEDEDVPEAVQAVEPDFIKEGSVSPVIQVEAYVTQPEGFAVACNKSTSATAPSDLLERQQPELHSPTGNRLNAGSFFEEAGSPHLPVGCVNGGLSAHTTDSRKFFVCLNGTQVGMNCPVNTNWNSSGKYCM